MWGPSLEIILSSMGPTHPSIMRLTILILSSSRTLCLKESESQLPSKYKVEDSLRNPRPMVYPRAGQKTRNPKPEPGIPEPEPKIPETRILFGNFG
jgi:hypothetical protein